MSNIVSVAVFAKAPIEGFAKTRLIPHLGPRKAANLQRRMIEHTINVARRSKLGPVSLWCAPSRRHKLFSDLAAADVVEMHDQLGTDLGARMLNAFEVLTSDHPVLVIGTDCLILEPQLLIDCANSLSRGYDVVFLPAEDGGYALVGAAKPLPALFLDMPWGTSFLMRKTRERARQMGLRFSESLPVWDIDTPADYERAIARGLIETRSDGDQTIHDVAVSL